jgi:hypothetical protein
MTFVVICKNACLIKWYIIRFIGTDLDASDSKAHWEQKVISIGVRNDKLETGKIFMGTVLKEQNC